MNRRKFLQWLGIGIPAAAVVAIVAPQAEKIVEAKLGEWHNYYSEGDPELMKAIENWHGYSEIYPDLKTTFTLPPGKALYFDKDFVSTLKRETDSLAATASRRVTTVNADCKREFFVYV